MKRNSLWLLTITIVVFTSVNPGTNYSAKPENLSQSEQIDTSYLSLEFMAEQLKEDLAFLKRALEEAHPGLYWHTSKEEFNNEMDRISSLITHPMTEPQFLRLIVPLMGNNWWMQNANLIPFNLMYLGDGFYVNQNFSGAEKLEFGTEILSINDEPISDIINNLLLYIPADGANKSRKYKALEWSFYRWYSYFIDHNSQTFELECLDPINKDIFKLSVHSISKDTLNLRRAKIKKENKSTNPPISFTVVDSLNLGILTIKTFQKGLIEEAGLKYKTFLKETFVSLNKKQINTLIIDLRNNGGGLSEYGATLNSYLTEKPFKYCNYQVVTTDTIISYITYDIPPTLDGFPDGMTKENGRYLWPHHSVLGVREPSSNNFKGQVYFLINGGCVSTTSEFSSVAHFNKQGTFIGVEVGGSYYGDSGGVSGTVKLPNTQIEVLIAMIKWELAVSGYDEKGGVAPEYEIYPNIDDLIIGIDTEMQFAFDLIKKSNKLPPTKNKRH